MALPANVVGRDLVQTIEVEHDAAQASARNAVAHAIRCGELLIEAKAAIPHGAFGAWLAANVSLSHDLVNKYMRIASLSEKNQNAVMNLSLRKALARIPSMTQKTKTPKPKKAPVKVTKPADLIAKRIVKDLERMKQADLTDPAWFAGQLHFHASRLNPLKMALQKGCK
jgi:hypothetical protein